MKFPLSFVCAHLGPVPYKISVGLSGIYFKYKMLQCSTQIICTYDCTYIYRQYVCIYIYANNFLKVKVITVVNTKC